MGEVGILTVDDRVELIDTILLTLLGGIGLTGIGFLVSALYTAKWELAVSSGIVELSILMPIRELVKLSARTSASRSCPS